MWAQRFLDSIASGKPSHHTLVAYQRDLDTIIELLAAETHCESDLVGTDAITVTALRGALTHALRHTFATTMARNPTVTVHTLAKMLGHESIATTQRYTEAAATNPHYNLL